MSRRAAEKTLPVEETRRSDRIGGSCKAEGARRKFGEIAGFLLRVGKA